MNGQKMKARSACMKIFETLLRAVTGRIDREAERVELVLGTHFELEPPRGRHLPPRTSSGLQLQSTLGTEFTLSEATIRPELYSALFQSMIDVDGRADRTLARRVGAGRIFIPLFNARLSEFLNAWLCSSRARGSSTRKATGRGTKILASAATRLIFFGVPVRWGSRQQSKESLRTSARGEDFAVVSVQEFSARPL